MEMIEGDQTLVSSFLSGILYMIDKLRKAVVPETVQKDCVLELLAALEVDAHRQFMALAKNRQLVGLVKAEKERLAEGLDATEACKVMADDDMEEAESDTEGESVAFGEHGNLEEQEQGREREDDGEEEVLGARDEYDNEKKHNGDLDEGSTKGGDIDEETIVPGSETIPTKARKRAKSKKAKQAKSQAKKQMKK